MDFRWIAIIGLIAIIGVTTHRFNQRIRILEKSMKARVGEIAELNSLLSSIENKAIYAVDKTEETDASASEVLKTVKEVEDEVNRIWKSLTTSIKLLSTEGAMTPEGEPVPTIPLIETDIGVTTPLNDDPYVEWDMP